MVLIEEAPDAGESVAQVPAHDHNQALDAGDSAAQAPTCNHEASANSSDAIAEAEVHRQEGNKLLAKGDYADACARYDKGLVALVRTSAAEAQQVSSIRLALHLNAALSNLRRGNFSSAVDHATGAVAIDPRNVKALYRRGTARAKLAEHGHNSQKPLAKADLEKALELDPSNGEIRAEVAKMRAAARSEKKELDNSQRNTFKNMFSGKAGALYEDTKSEEPAPIFYDAPVADSHELVLAAKDLSFSYSYSEQILKEVNLQLRAGWCVGLFGNNAAGKTTLARLLSQKLSPSGGAVEHHGTPRGKQPTKPGNTWLKPLIITALIGGALAVEAGLLLGEEAVRRLSAKMSALHWAAVVACAVIVMLAVSLVSRWYAERRARRVVLHVTSETTDKEEIPGTKTVEDTIGEKLPRNLSAAQRRDKVIAMLKAANFQMYNQATGEPVGTPAEYVQDKLRFGTLSGGQRHLIYVLRNFASNPDVIVGDELLGGLDAFRQPRVLHMLRRMKEEAGTAILYVGTELHQLRLVADSVGFMSGGKICELGPAEEVMDFPRHPETKEYISVFRGLPGGRVLGGKLAESYAALVGDPDLAGPWLPCS